jgi:hypothetical protein
LSHRQVKKKKKYYEVETREASSSKNSRPQQQPIFLEKVKSGENQGKFRGKSVENQGEIRRNSGKFRDRGPML